MQEKKFVREPQKADFECKVTMSSTILTINGMATIRNSFEESLNKLLNQYDMELTELGNVQKKVYGDLLLTTQSFVFLANLKDLSEEPSGDAS